MEYKELYDMQLEKIKNAKTKKEIIELTKINMKIFPYGLNNETLQSICPYREIIRKKAAEIIMTKFGVNVIQTIYLKYNNIINNITKDCDYTFEIITQEKPSLNWFKSSLNSFITYAVENNLELEPDFYFIYFKKGITKWGYENLTNILIKLKIKLNLYKNKNDFSILELYYILFKNSWDLHKKNEDDIKFLKLELEYLDLLRDAENELRVEKGLKKVGEGWVEETKLYILIKETFSEYEVIAHARLPELGRQHLDIYIPKLNLGIEYQGEQHFKAIDFFGGEEGLQNNIKRDKLKKEKCEKNNIKLLYVYPQYDKDVFLKDLKGIINERTT